MKKMKNIRRQMKWERLKITFASELAGNPVEIGKVRRKFDGYLPAIHNLSEGTRFEIVEGNELRRLQEEDVLRQ